MKPSYKEGEELDYAGQMQKKFAQHLESDAALAGATARRPKRSTKRRRPAT